ncbi:PepSY-like domain-containing protein [Mesonia ostreae]|uniref:PepSY-like domain-containing protein n=1 Tax=Mesonia ostreae TaxID=861110 RepID=A0ABU2KM02_9FLAO|nr:PepSY-like domain-containing protein [Mesonia ostreae]MDT0295659.1 PepSY-like domain-containing protein [Mesonia ostreae]
MKKFLKPVAFLSLSVLTLISCSNDDENSNSDQVIQAEELPASAKTFVTTYFPNTTYTRVEKNNQVEPDGTLYEVNLSNGFEVDFSSEGNWLDVDGQTQELPQGIVPESIANYVIQNYADLQMIGIDTESTEYEIDLSNGLDLYFTLAGEFVREENN